MDRDRRQSMRVSTRLPCRWQLFTDPPTKEHLRRVFDLHRSPAFQPDLEAVQDKILSSLRKVADQDIRYTLALMNQKIDFLSRQRPNQDPLDELDIVLSVTGLEFPVDCQADPGTWIGVYLFLDEGTSFLGAGQVSRCTPAGANFRLGITLAEMDPQNARKLARFVMRQRSRLPAA